jgi:hypothetical protein
MNQLKLFPISHRALICLGLVYLCGCLESHQQAPDVEFSTCENPLPGIDWGDSNIPEAFSDIDAELAATDISGLSDPIDISEMAGIYRGFIAYALGIAPDELGDSLEHATALAAGSLGEVVLASIARDASGEAGMDFTFFRRGFHRYYTCSRGYPTTLEGFFATFLDYRDMQGEIVDSIAKCDDRNLILDSASQVYVAETLVEGDVRETEILLNNNREDGQLDFVVYDEHGTLTERSIFPNAAGDEIVAAAPYSCMSCHFDADAHPTTWSFNRLVPSSGPCANMP